MIQRLYFVPFYLVLLAGCILDSDGLSPSTNNPDSDINPGDTDPDTDPDQDSDEPDAPIDGDPDIEDDCVPSAELCDGLDNDCDPETPDGADESWYDTPCDGSDEDGCEEGVYICQNLERTCTDTSGNNREECNGIDDDCDDVIDEDGSGDGIACPCTIVRSEPNLYLLCLTLEDGQRASWSDAQSFCDGRGYGLVTIESEAENTFLYEQTQELDPEEHWWIGLNDKGVEGSFVWDATGETLSKDDYSNWSPGDHTNTGRNCVLFLRNNGEGRWNDSACRHERHFICEFTLP